MGADSGKLRMPSIEEMEQLSNKELNELVDRSCGIMNFREHKDDVIAMLKDFSIGQSRDDMEYIVWVDKERGICLLLKRTQENEEMVRRLGGAKE